MGLEPQEAVSTMLAPKLFVEKECSQGRKEIPHTKLLPECRNVTKQNCVTLWETDADGKQVRQLKCLSSCHTFLHLQKSAECNKI